MLGAVSNLYPLSFEPSSKFALLHLSSVSCLGVIIVIKIDNIVSKNDNSVIKKDCSFGCSVCVMAG